MEDERKFVTISSNDSNLFNKFNYPPTYGILEREGIQNMVQRVNTSNINPLDNNQIKFIDLGSGDGRIPIIMVRDHNTNCGHGIEFSEARHNKAMERYQKCSDIEKKKLKFIHGDMLDKNKINLEPYNVIYISSLCFPPHLLEGIKNKVLNECRNGTHIFTSKGILGTQQGGSSEHEKEIIKLNEEFNIKQSWSNDSRVFWYTVNKNVENTENTDIVTHSGGAKNLKNTRKNKRKSSRRNKRRGSRRNKRKSSRRNKRKSSRRNKRKSSRRNKRKTFRRLRK